MPPVGQNFKFGSGLSSDFINGIPPAADAGKILFLKTLPHLM